MPPDIPHDVAALAILEAVAGFHQRGWLLGTCGNFSVLLSRQTRQLLVTPSGRDKSRISAEDLLVVDVHGQVLQGRGKASEELSVHREIYDRTDAGAIYHVHSVPNNLASRWFREQGHVIFQDIEMIKGLAGKTLYDQVALPIASNHQEMDRLADSVARSLRPDVPGVLVYQHGLYAWGKTPDEARRHVEIFEFLLDFVSRLHGRSL